MHTCCCCYEPISKHSQEALANILIESFDSDIAPQFSHAISFIAFAMRFKCIFNTFTNSLAMKTGVQLAIAVTFAFYVLTQFKVDIVKSIVTNSSHIELSVGN